MNDSRGLTLKGVIVVIVALAVLGVLFFPWHGGVREKALRAECCSNLHQIGLALIQYAEDNGGLYPAFSGAVKATETAPGIAALGDGAALQKLLYPSYIPDNRIFWCPTTPPGEGELSSYAYDPRHSVLPQRVPGMLSPVALAADRGGGAQKNSPNHAGDGQNVLYNDFHVEWKKTTNVGYNNDEIFVRNDDLREKDSWLIE